MAAHQSKSHEFEDNQEWQEAQFQQRGYSKVLPALFRTTPGPYQRDYHTWANYESLDGVKDARGPVGMNATRKRGLRCSQPLLGGLTK
jgi:hypothetical protein